MFGTRRYLEQEVARLHRELAEERQKTATLAATYQAEYHKLLDRLLGARGVPESPAEMRNAILGADLWEEEADLREDTRQPAESIAGE